MNNKYYLLLLFIVSSIIVSAQEIPPQYIFDEFKHGKLVNKKGDIHHASFNYDIIDQRLMFISADSTILEIADPEEVSFVKIDEHIFEQIKGAIFYERVNIGNCIFYIQWKAKLISKGKAGAYGTTSSTTSISSISSINNAGQMLKLDIAEKYDVKHEDFYYLKIKNSLKRFYSADSLAKLFKGHEEDIKKHVKENNLDFNKTAYPQYASLKLLTLWDGKRRKIPKGFPRISCSIFR